MASPCCVEPGAKQTHQSQGSVEEIAGVNTYKTGQGKSAIVVFTDVFGYAYPNNRKVADRFAEDTGATVLVPDYFHEDPVNANLPNYRDTVPDWLKKHPTTEACAIAEKFISTIKGDYDSIQVIGLCYGAAVVVYLTSHPETPPAIKAAAVAHAAFLIAEQAAQIKQHILFLCAETDFTFSEELKQHFEKELIPKGLGTFLTYPGTVHGFVTRPDGTEPSNQGSEKAIQDVVEFFRKNI